MNNTLKKNSSRKNSSRKNSSRKNSLRKNSSRKNKINKLKGGGLIKYNDELIKRIEQNDPNITELEPFGEFTESFVNGEFRPSKLFINFVNALEKNTSIKNLTLSNLSIKLAKILVNSLVNNKTLTILKFKFLHSNDSKDSDLYSYLITRMPTLTTFIANHGSIDSTGIKNYLGPALKENTTLKTLDISMNENTYKEIIELYNALINNKTITTLDIRNDEEDDPADYIAENYNYDIELKNLIINGKLALQNLKTIINKNKDNVLNTVLYLECNNDNFIGKHLESLQKQFPNVDHISKFVNKDFKTTFKTTQACVNDKGQAFKNAFSDRALGTFQEIIKKAYHPKGLIFDQIE